MVYNTCVLFFSSSPLGTWNNRPRELTYMSPEESGRLRLVPDHRADLWSAGVLFFQMLTVMNESAF